MDSINDYKCGDSFDNYVIYNNIIFIVNIISVGIFALYSLICCIVNKLKEEDSVKFEPNRIPLSPVEG